MSMLLRMGELVALSDGEKRMMKETEVEEQRKKKQRQKEDDDDDGSAEVVSWDKFLPRRELRVLLVEADHSTRQIIAALLRKCSYRVVAVPDGLKAWRMLKRKAPDIDLILTEVELPSISGFALLTLIVEDDICKNIPVIMMSSHDSVSMVLKCMLKGAADFLIKPVRRNELRNLWQHVWRRHAIGRPPQNMTFPPKKLEDSSENNAVSNQSSGSVTSTRKNNECSEKVSEAQSTCTSPFLEAESAYMENMQGTSQLKGSLNLSNTETLKHRESARFEMESAKHNETVVEKSIRLVLEDARWHKTFETTDLRLETGHSCTETVNQDDVLREELASGNPYSRAEIHRCCNELVEPSGGALDLIATFENRSKNTDVNCSLNCGGTTNFGFDTRLELHLRSDFPGSPCKQATEESQTLNPSNASAFSWYSGSKLLPPHFQSSSITSAKENNTNRDDSHESYKLSGKTVDTCQYGDKNQDQENMTALVIGRSGQIGPKLPHRQCGLFPIAGVTSDHKSEQQGNVFPSAFHAQSGVRPIWTPKPVCQNENSPFPTSISSQSNPENHNLEHHHHCSDDATHSSLDQNVHGKSNLDHARNESPAADQSAGNNLCHDIINHINSSAYDSKGSRSDGNATSSVVAENNLESFSDSGCVKYDGFRGTEPHHSSQREAALTKFRLKRKDRCYEKKVRYQSRKRLAEQRPRVKGQFVRQSTQ